MLLNAFVFVLVKKVPTNGTELDISIVDNSAKHRQNERDQGRITSNESAACLDWIVPTKLTHAG